MVDINQNTACNALPCFCMCVVCPYSLFPSCVLCLRRVVFAPLSVFSERRLRARLPLFRELLCYLIEALPLEVFLKQLGNLACTLNIEGEASVGCLSLWLIVLKICHFATMNGGKSVPKCPQLLRISRKSSIFARRLRAEQEIE